MTANVPRRDARRPLYFPRVPEDAEQFGAGSVAKPMAGFSRRALLCADQHIPQPPGEPGKRFLMVLPLWRGIVPGSHQPAPIKALDHPMAASQRSDGRKPAVSGSDSGLNQGWSSPVTSGCLVRTRTAARTSRVVFPSPEEANSRTNFPAKTRHN
jgi:hypothetical protein